MSTPSIRTKGPIATAKNAAAGHKPGAHLRLVPVSEQGGADAEQPDEADPAALLDRADPGRPIEHPDELTDDQVPRRSLDHRHEIDASRRALPQNPLRRVAALEDQVDRRRGQRQEQKHEHRPGSGPLLCSWQRSARQPVDLEPKGQRRGGQQRRGRRRRQVPGASHRDFGVSHIQNPAPGTDNHGRQHHDRHSDDGKRDGRAARRARPALDRERESPRQREQESRGNGIDEEVVVGVRDRSQHAAERDAAAGGRPLEESRCTPGSQRQHPGVHEVEVAREVHQHEGAPSEHHPGDETRHGSPGVVECQRVRAEAVGDDSSDEHHVVRHDGRPRWTQQHAEYRLQDRVRVQQQARPVGREQQVAPHSRRMRREGAAEPPRVPYEGDVVAREDAGDVRRQPCRERQQQPPRRRRQTRDGHHVTGRAAHQGVRARP